MEIRRYEHGEGDLWQRVGAFLVSTAVRRELGGPISSDETTVWWLAIDDDGDTVGFVTARRRKDVWEFRHDYVTPSARGKGVYERLFRSRLQEWIASGAPAARATVNEHSLSVYEHYGFKAVGQRGKYVVVQRESDGNEPIR